MKEKKTRGECQGRIAASYENLFPLFFFNLTFFFSISFDEALRKIDPKFFTDLFQTLPRL